jgi:hypothetical protein
MSRMFPAYLGSRGSIGAVNAWAQSVMSASILMSLSPDETRVAVSKNYEESADRSIWIVETARRFATRVTRHSAIRGLLRCVATRGTSARIQPQCGS